jgi:hypothetical protein
MNLLPIFKFPVKTWINFNNWTDWLKFIDTYQFCLKSDNNSIEFFIIYVLSQQPQGQLQTQHSVDKSSYILDKHNIKSKTN